MDNEWLLRLNSDTFRSLKYASAFVALTAAAITAQPLFSRFHKYAVFRNLFQVVLKLMKPGRQRGIFGCDPFNAL